MSKILLLLFPNSQLLKPLLIIPWHIHSILMSVYLYPYSILNNLLQLCSYCLSTSSWPFYSSLWHRSGTLRKRLLLVVASYKLFWLEALQSFQAEEREGLTPSCFPFSWCHLSNVASRWWWQLIPEASADSGLQHQLKPHWPGLHCHVNKGPTGSRGSVPPYFSPHQMPTGNLTSDLLDVNLVVPTAHASGSVIS